MFNFESAVSFVQANGNPVEKARLNILLNDVAVENDAVDELKNTQRADGSWSPFWAPDSSSLDATCYRLAQCEQLGVKQSEAFIQKAISFLIKNQHPSGYFEEYEKLSFVAPPWAKPGEKSARLYITANVGFWIQYFQRDDASSIKAGNYLVNALNEEGFLPTYLHANWLAVGLLFSLGKEKMANTIVHYLHGKLESFSASNLSWLINCLVIMGVPTKLPILTDAIDKLQLLQHKDGYWESDDGAWQNVHTTLESLRALKFYGVLDKIY